MSNIKVDYNIQNIWVVIKLKEIGRTNQQRNLHMLSFLSKSLADKAFSGKIESLLLSEYSAGGNH